MDYGSKCSIVIDVCVVVSIMDSKEFVLVPMSAFMYWNWEGLLPRMWVLLRRDRELPMNEVVTW